MNCTALTLLGGAIRVVKCWTEAAEATVLCQVSSNAGLGARWCRCCGASPASCGLIQVTRIHLSGGTTMGGLSRRTKGSGKTCIPVRCVLGCSPSCQGVQSVHRSGLCHASLCCTLHFPEVALFLGERSYCISVKVQHKGLFEKQGLKTFLLQQLWASCD